MTLTELLDKCDQSAASAKEFGNGSPCFIVLVTPRKPRGEMMRLFPGLLGRVIGSTEKGTLVSCKVPDVMRYLVRHIEWVERESIICSERGDIEQADHWMAQYVEMSARLQDR